MHLENFPLVVDMLDLLVSDDLIDWENFHRLILWITFLFSLRLTEIDARKRSWNVKIRYRLPLPSLSLFLFVFILTLETTESEENQM